MKIVLISAAVVGLCAVAEAGSIGFGSSIIGTSAGYLEQLQNPGMEVMPAAFDYTMFSVPPAFLDTEPSTRSHSRAKEWASEPPLALIVMSGLGFIMLAGALRAVPPGLRRLNAMRLDREVRHGHRRRVKIEIRMMA